MTHSWTRRGKKLYRYYSCLTAQKQGRVACPTPSLPTGPVESIIVGEIKRLAQDPAMIEQILPEAVHMAESERERLEADRTRLLRHRQQQEAAIQRLVSAVESQDGQTPEAMTERVAERQAELATLNDRLAEVEHEIASACAREITREHLTETLTKFTDLWDVLYPQERNELLNALIDSIIYYDATDTLEIRFKATDPDVTESKTFRLK